MAKEKVEVLKEWLDNLNKAVEAQANDETLWAVNIPGQEFKIGIGEAYVQQSLRWLHKVIEYNDQGAMKAIVDQSNGDV